MIRYILIAVLGLCAIAQADVTRKHKVTSTFMGASEGTTAEYYSGDKHATEGSTKYTSGFMKTATGGKPTESGDITRLDKELVWSLDPKKKTYTEMTFAEYRDQLKKGQAELEDAKKQEPADTAGEDLYTWTVVDKSDPATKTINGFACKNLFMEATGVNKKDSLDKVIIVINTWNSPDVPGGPEMMDFNVKYLQKLGLNNAALVPNLMAASALYQKQFEAMMEAAKKAPGEAVQSTIEIKRNQLKTKPIGKAVGEAAQNELMSKMPFGGLKKKEPPKDEKPTWELVTKFSATSELTEATTTAVDQSKFEIPAGFKLKKK